MPLSQSSSVLIIVLMVVSFLGSYLASLWLYKLAIYFNIVDDPESNPDRKKQTKPIPLLGGSGFALVTIFLMGLVWLINKFNWFNLTHEIGQNLEPFKLIWVLAAIVILLIGGFVDDKYKVSSKIQLIFVHVAIFVAIFGGGLTIENVSYPFNALIPHTFFLEYILSYFWLLFCTGATKFLDGHDGMVSSVGIIGLLSIASVSLFDNVNQPMVFIFSLIWIFGIMGFLPFNFPEAKMYLGEGGSEIIGFMIGVLAILSGAKIATASTVIGWFIIDLLFVWWLRFWDKRNPFSSGDRLHWHFRLVDSGLNKISVLALTALILIITTQAGLLIKTEHKPFLLLGQVFFLLMIFLITEILRHRKNK